MVKVIGQGHGENHRRKNVFDYACALLGDIVCGKLKSRPDLQTVNH